MPKVSNAEVKTNTIGRRDKKKVVKIVLPNAVERPKRSAAGRMP